MKAFTEVRFKGTPEEISEQWRAERNKGIGGSDAAAILGLSKYSTPLSVWMEKTGRTVPDDISDKEPVHWGNVLEDVVATEFAKRHPELKVRRRNALLRSNAHPFMQASLDREITDGFGRKGILEIKTANERMKGDWESGIPDYYLPQPIHYLAVTDYAFYAVAVLIGGQHYEEFFYDRDQSDIDFLIEQESAFWKLVSDDVMPAISAADSSLMVDLYPVSNDAYVDILDEDIPELDLYIAKREQLKALDEECKELGVRLKERIGDNKGILTPTKKITWTKSQSSQFNTKKLKAEQPDVYSKYAETKPRDGGLRVSDVKE